MAIAVKHTGCHRNGTHIFPQAVHLAVYQTQRGCAQTQGRLHFREPQFIIVKPMFLIKRNGEGRMIADAEGQRGIPGIFHGQRVTQDIFFQSKGRKQSEFPGEGGQGFRRILHFQHQAGFRLLHKTVGHGTGEAVLGRTFVDLPSLIPPGPVKDYVDGNVRLANGSGELAKGSVNLADGSVVLANGSVRLANGSVVLARGSSSLANGSVDLAHGSLSLAAGSQLLSSYATQALFTAAASLGSSAESLSSITGINETILGDYFLAPVKLDRHELFSVPNYGSQVSPFYLVLSMWVGALITCAMLKIGISEGTKYSPLEMYFGKQLLFIILSILQVSVTLIGAYLLGIYIVNPWLFVISAMLISVVFMILMYSLVSALGNVGKAIAIVLLVIQISGTGGIYPVQIMQPIFQILHPYLPMTYAITLMREAQLGLVWSNYFPALIILICIGIATVIASIIVKMKADKAAHYFEKCLEDSGLF